MGGGILGSIPYSKFQAVPIAAAIALIFIHVLWKKTLDRKEFLKRMAIFSAGACLFTAVIILYLLAFALVDDFIKSYICQNLLFYSKLFSSVPCWEKLTNSLHALGETPDTNIYFFLTAFILIAGLLFMLRNRVNPPNSCNGNARPAVPVFIYYALALLLASFYSVTAPGNAATHYLLFLIIPCGFAIGVFLGEFDQYLTENETIILRRKVRPYAMFVFLIVAVSSLHFYLGMHRGNRYLANHKSYLDNYRTPVGMAILRHAGAGESMVLWGWSPQFHVETGLVPATRDTVSVWQVWPSSLRKYYMDRFIKDMERSAPKLFVDATNYRPTIVITMGQRHELFPEIDGIVKRQYKFAEEIENVRIYTRQ